MFHQLIFLSSYQMNTVDFDIEYIDRYFDSWYNIIRGRENA